MVESLFGACWIKLESSRFEEFPRCHVQRILGLCETFEPDQFFSSSFRNHDDELTRLDSLTHSLTPRLTRLQAFLACTYSVSFAEWHLFGSTRHCLRVSRLPVWSTHIPMCILCQYITPTLCDTTCAVRRFITAIFLRRQVESNPLEFRTLTTDDTSLVLRCQL